MPRTRRTEVKKRTAEKRVVTGKAQDLSFGVASAATGGRSASSAGIWTRRIGIVGGLGPFAHLELERRLLEAATLHVGRALRDQEFPPWLLACVPQVPDRSAAVLSSGASPVPMLLQGLRLLKQADFAIIACNTAHLFLEELRAQADIPILDLVGETVSTAVRSSTVRRIGVLGSTATLRAALYQRAAEASGARVKFVTPLDLGEDVQRRFVTDVIFGSEADADHHLQGGIKAGAHRIPSVRREMEARLLTLLGWLQRAGADAIIVGCTELSLLLAASPCQHVRLIDPLQVAAESAVRIAAGARPLPGL